jgi:hypothetical protein
MLVKKMVPDPNYIYPLKCWGTGTQTVKLYFDPHSKVHIPLKQNYSGCYSYRD